MKVLLIKDVKTLGRAGEVKEVKDGYANNFLIAKGLAKAATTEVLRKYESDLKRQAEELRYEIENYKKQALEIEKLTIIIKKQVGANGVLFGSITKDEVSKAIKEQANFDIDKKIIEFDTIKNLGKFDAYVKFKHSIKAKFNLEIIEQE